MDRGRGSGYRNVIANYDSKIHSMSAKGVKQPQRFRVWVTPEGSEKQIRTNKTFKDKKEADNFAYVETLAGMGEVYNVKGGKDKFNPSMLTAIDTTITDYMKLSDKSNLTPVEKARLERIEKKLTKVHVGKQLKNYMKTHRVMLISAAAGLGTLAGSLLMKGHATDPMVGASLLAYPLGYAAYETKLVEKLEGREFDKLNRKFPHLSKPQKEQLAIRLVRKDLYGGKAGDNYALFEKDGQVYRYELNR
jgi:hypothetical protein